VLRFGDEFELDVRAYELRSAGIPIKLKPIPMEMLLFLVEHRGELVTREQIVERIWGKGVFLDTDNSINGAISRIRQVLRDDAERPRFVQTVTSKGYRFIAPVVEQVVAEKKSPPGVVGSPAPAARRMWTWGVAATAIFLAASALYTARMWQRISSTKLTEKDTVILADFVNATGDPVFDDALKQALSVELTQSPFLNVASDVQVSEMLRRMGRMPSDPLTGELAREVCLRMGGKAVLVGSISSLGSHYVVGLQALGCVGGDILATGQAEAATKERVLQALDGVASQVRRKVGESLSSLEKYDFPVNTTTTSLDALRAFSLGQRALRRSGEWEAIPFFRQATQLDPDFGLAYAALGRAYEDLGEDREAVEDFTRAYDLRTRLSEREKYYVTTLYNETVTGDLERAKENGELWIRAYPRDGIAREKLGTVYGELGQQAQAYPQFQEALRLDPESTINVFNSVMVSTALNRLDEAQGTLESAQARGLDGPVIHESIYSLAFVGGDPAEMERQVAWAAAKGDTEYVLFSQHSDTEAYYGRLAKARELSRRAVESATRNEAKETAAICEIAAALREMETGNLSLARQGARAALSLTPSRSVKLLATLVFVNSGDTARAQALTRELETKNPSNTLIKLYWLPTLKASLDLHAGKPQEALSLLRVPAPYELSQTSNVSNTTSMYPAYVRGEAYLLAHDGGAAAAEFKRLLDHRGIVQNSILGALSQLQLARAEVMMGDLVSARKQYLDFLALWKDADPDLPILKRAKAEYAKL
jgi:DNA-binding winged helix-turn-helix (wHTH) protein/tetratricopeptide (TPR) repeat protein